MRIPAFTAESSVYRTSSVYRVQLSSPRVGERTVSTQSGALRAANVVVPAEYWCRMDDETGDIECEEERPV
jgi:hypothetical protein